MTNAGNIFKNTVTEMKNALNDRFWRLDSVKERICELVDKSQDIIQAKEKKDIRKKKSEEGLCE